MGFKDLIETTGGLTYFDFITLIIWFLIFIIGLIGFLIKYKKSIKWIIPLLIGIAGTAFYIGKILGQLSLLNFIYK